jgi:hypothetical protein
LNTAFLVRRDDELTCMERPSAAGSTIFARIKTYTGELDSPARCALPWRELSRKGFFSACKSNLLNAESIRTRLNGLFDTSSYL